MRVGNRKSIVASSVERYLRGKIVCVTRYNLLGVASRGVTSCVVLCCYCVYSFFSSSTDNPEVILTFMYRTMKLFCVGFKILIYKFYRVSDYLSYVEQHIRSKRPGVCVHTCYH